LLQSDVGLIGYLVV